MYTLTLNVNDTILIGLLRILGTGNAILQLLQQNVTLCERKQIPENSWKLQIQWNWSHRSANHQNWVNVCKRDISLFYFILFHFIFCFVCTSTFPSWEIKSYVDITTALSAHTEFSLVYGIENRGKRKANSNKRKVSKAWLKQIESQSPCKCITGLFHSNTCRTMYCKLFKVFQD